MVVKSNDSVSSFGSIQKSSLASSSAPTSPTTTTITTNSRDRAKQKDEQIRRQAESSLGRQQQNQQTQGKGKYKRATGAGASSSLNEPVTIQSTQNIREAARALAAKRTDCLLVVNEQGRLLGIATDKDLAFRVVSEGLDPQSTLITAVMTASPQCVQATTPLPEALQMMASRHFRHLPCLEGEKIVGVLDVARCVCDALRRLEKADDAAGQLEAALKAVESQFGKTRIGGGESEGMAASLREQLASPTLASLLDMRIQAADLCVSPKTTVIAAVKQMKAARSTAIIVSQESEDELSMTVQGIFTTKDLVLRVLAAGLDPNTTSVVRVMTPKPDTVTTETTVVAALSQMEAGHYLHLPVVSRGDGRLLGIVSVLQLACHIIEQVEALEGKGDGEGSLGWSQLWLRNNNNLNTEGADSKASSVFRGTTRPGPIFDRTDDAHSIASLGDTIGANANLSIVYKIKYGNTAVYIDQPPNNTYTLNTLITESQARHGVKGSNGGPFKLVFFDEDGDKVPLASDEDLAHVTRMVQSVGRVRVNLGLFEADQVSLEGPTKANKNDSSILIFGLCGAVAAVGIAAAAGWFYLQGSKNE